MAYGTTYVFNPEDGWFYTKAGAPIVAPWQHYGGEYSLCAHDLVDDDGKFEPYAWPGGYPIAYFDEQDNILCAGCASKGGYSFRVEYAMIIQEGTTYCDDCSSAIFEGEDEEEEEGE